MKRCDSMQRSMIKIYTGAGSLTSHIASEFASVGPPLRPFSSGSKVVTMTPLVVKGLDRGSTARNALPCRTTLSLFSSDFATSRAGPAR